MGQPRYDRLRLVIGEGNSDMSSAIKDSLGVRGLRKVVTCSGTDHLFDALDTEIVDLLLYDYDLLGNDFVDVMQRIRRKARGKNPFVIIVATVKDSAVETVRRLISAGVDDLIRKPVSVDRLFESLGNFSAKRKPFVVSYDYVGPTRRVGRRTDEPASQLIRVPNTLRSRAIEGVSDMDLERLVESAVAGLDDKQLDSCGIEIDILAKRIVDNYGLPTNTHEDEQDVRGALHRIEVVADDLRSRAKDTINERVSDLATMLVAISQRVLRAPSGRALVEVQLLGKLASAIRRALLVERSSVMVMQEITSTIARYTSKN
ncbi:MAG TPA: response regulator [Magnetospirillaceae bacterium]